MCAHLLLKQNISAPTQKRMRQRECFHQLDSSKICQQSEFVAKIEIITENIFVE